MLPLIRNLTPDQLIAFVAERRAKRAAKVYIAKKRAPKQTSIATLSKDLGIDKHEIAKRIEKELNANQ